MQQRLQVAAVDDRFERVGIFEEACELACNRRGTLRLERAVRDRFGQVLSVQILHGDVEVAGVFVDSVLIDDRHVRATLAESLLELGAKLLRLDDLARLPVAPALNELQRNLAIVAAIGRQKDHGHPAMADLPEDLVRTDLFEHGGHRRSDGSSADTNQFSRVSSPFEALSKPTNDSLVTPTNTFLAKVGVAR